MKLDGTTEQLVWSSLSPFPPPLSLSLPCPTLSLFLSHPLFLSLSISFVKMYNLKSAMVLTTARFYILLLSFYKLVQFLYWYFPILTELHSCFSSFLNSNAYYWYIVNNDKFLVKFQFRIANGIRTANKRSGLLIVTFLPNEHFSTISQR